MATVSTWADGFGVWHARVTEPGAGAASYGDGSAQPFRELAQQAIRAEIASRQADQSFTVRVRCVASDTDSLTFAEITDMTTNGDSP